MARLTFYFIVEPPKYQHMACYLAGSIRVNFGDQVALVGYCPAHRMAELDPDAVAVLARMGCEVRPMVTEGRFDPPYPHGNKMLATLERRETEYSCFLDSDILFLRPNRIENLIHEGAVSLTPAASMGWAGQDVWPKIYAAAGVEMPEERIRLMNQRGGKDRMPYFSSGLFCFRGLDGGGRSDRGSARHSCQAALSGPDDPAAGDPQGGAGLAYPAEGAALHPWRDEAG